MSKFKVESASHWYQVVGGVIKPAYNSTLKDARKQGLFISPTSIEKDIRANPVLAIWLKNQILKAAADDSRQPHESVEEWCQRIIEKSNEVTSTAAEFGTKVHKGIEEYLLQGEFANSNEVSPWVSQFASWAQTQGLSMMYSELCVALPHMGVAGRTDFIGTMNSVKKENSYEPDIVVADFKTQNVKEGKGPAFYDSWARQLAAYAYGAAYTLNLPSIPRCMSIVIDSNKPSEPVVKLWTKEEIERAWMQFQTQAWLWFDDRQYWPCGQWEVSPIWNKAQGNLTVDLAEGPVAKQHEAMYGLSAKKKSPLAGSMVNPFMPNPTDTMGTLKYPAVTQQEAKKPAKKKTIVPAKVSKEEPFTVPIEITVMIEPSDEDKKKQEEALKKKAEAKSKAKPIPPWAKQAEKPDDGKEILTGNPNWVSAMEFMKKIQKQQMEAHNKQQMDYLSAMQKAKSKALF